MRPPPLPPMAARCPEDLLAMIPVTLGFVPTDSVAMLTFGADHPFHARIDLPRSRADVPEAVECLLEPCVRHHVAQVVLVLFTTDETMAGHAWRALRDGFHDAGIRVVEALRADGRRWFPLLGGDGRDGLDGDPGVAYDVSAHPFVVQAVLAGRVTLADRDELAATLRPVPAQVAEVAAALERRPATWARDAAPPDAVVLREGEWTELLVEHLVRQGRSPSTDDVARLLRAMVLLPVRDAAWQTITADDAEDHVAWWTDLLRRTPPGLESPVATLLAWSAWLAGHGALAWCALDVALAVEPDLALAIRLGELLTAAVPPAAFADLETPDWRAGLRPAA